jgi:hypothetical protein
MKALKSFQIFANTYPVADDNIPEDLNLHGAFIQEHVSLFSHITL